MTPPKCFRFGAWGSVITAICCFTLALVIGLGFVGLATLTPYLDLVLLPMLAFFLILAAYGRWQRKRTST